MTLQGPRQTKKSELQYTCSRSDRLKPLFPNIKASEHIPIGTLHNPDRTEKLRIRKTDGYPGSGQGILLSEV